MTLYHWKLQVTMEIQKQSDLFSKLNLGELAWGVSRQ
jgi:hypothetical protein